MIELKKVSFKYNSGIQDNGLKNVDLFIKKGEVVLLCGESGCGKTTLTRLINGLIPHYYNGNLTGEVLVNGREVSKTPLYETAKFVGSVFQNPRSQFYCLDTVSELAFGCENQGMPLKKIIDRINLTANHLNIQDLMEKNIFCLSGGEKQKIACGCVHTSSTDIIVLDEPSSNLDPHATNSLGQIINHWKKEGKTIIIAEHRLHYLRDVADRIVFMNEGQIEKELSMPQAKQLKHNQLQQMGLRALSLEDLKPEYNSKNTADDFIELSGFKYSYDNEKKVLDMGTLAFPKGKIVGIIGYNGAGKTTFARCLCGLNRKFKGKVKSGYNTYRNKQCLKKSYMVMQDVNHQLFTESVLDEVLLSMNEHDIKKAESILDSLNLLHMSDLHPMSLSGGQKQRVAIAAAIASDREIVIFDEPTSGLDLRHMIQVSENLRRLKKMGKTLLIITHDLELLLRICDYVLHLDNGQVHRFYRMSMENSVSLISFFTSQTTFSNTQ